MSPPDPTAEHPGPADTLAGALRQLLGPLARLALARGLTHATLDELLKQALVDAADRQHAALPPHRRVSRISTATGIHRREVTRLVEVLREGKAQAAPAQRSLASELFTHWRTDPAYAAPDGQPAALPRQGQGSGPSFERLAQTITRDVHPRSLLDELQRLGLVALDAATDTVRLTRERFVPQGDDGRLVAVLGRNVGSHLDAAVDNVLIGPGQHLEQAIFADGLGEQSLAEFRRLMTAQWQGLLAAMVPALEAMVARDDPAQGAPAGPRHRVRLGLYAHARADTPAALPAPHSPDPSPAGAPDAPESP